MIWVAHAILATAAVVVVLFFARTDLGRAIFTEAIVPVLLFAAFIGAGFAVCWAFGTVYRHWSGSR